MNSIKSLLVLWKNKLYNQYFHIGTLYFNGEQYKFHYTFNSDSPRKVKDAIQNGYRLHPIFPELEEEYTSNSMFATFDRRIPSSDRVDYSNILSDLGLASDADQMDILRETRGMLSGDAYSFEAPLRLYDDQHLETEFYVNGMRHRKLPNDWFTRIHIGDELVTALEPDNEQDPNAVRLENMDGLHLGYVPAVYAAAVKSLIETEIDVRLKVADIRPESAPQWWIRLDFYCDLKKIDEKLILDNQIIGGLILETA